MLNSATLDGNTYKIGLYYRLSREDGDDLESESISNQRDILHNFLKNIKFSTVQEYMDDGYSGGNFNRPGFIQLIKDVEQGKVDCIITKDLSRLGRDHIDTGRYVERYFPEHNIRYIAINDDIDTFKETSGIDMMPFRLSMNDMYAKDISKKVRSALMAMKKKGKYCGSVPPYGYKRDETDKHKLVPDPITAPIVKKIFELYISGCGSSAIARYLTEEGYPTPVLLKCSKTKVDSAFHPEIWKDSSVNNILKNLVYTGCVVQHTSQTVSYKSKKRRKIPKKDWCVVENTHEPIIDKKTYEFAQNIRNKSNYFKGDRKVEEYTLANIVYCKDCGARMGITYDKSRDRVIMNCRNYTKFSKYHICFSHFINYRNLEQLICDRLSQLSKQYSTDKNEFEQAMRSNYLDPKKEMLGKIQKAKLEIQSLKKKQDSLYDDKFNDIIDAETYKRLFAQSSTKIENLNSNIKKYELELKTLEEQKDNTDEFGIIIEEYLSMKKPTRELIRKLVDKIYITKDKTVEIYYKFNAETLII